ncbi:MAG: PilZ domain-containing protein [Planctomycetota bacterium]|nr:PilZ domain-containing protein [Planctomycetota bacterium]
MARLQSEQSQASCSKAQFNEILDAIPAGEAPAHERRTEKRHQYLTMVMVTPLDADLQPSGDPFPALTRDISASGIGLVHSRPIHGPFVKFDLPHGDTALSVIVNILRCNQLLCGDQRLGGFAIDDMCTYYESGGRFLTKVNVVELISK